MIDRLHHSKLLLQDFQIIINNLANRIKCWKTLRNLMIPEGSNLCWILLTKVQRSFFNLCSYPTTYAVCSTYLKFKVVDIDLIVGIKSIKPLNWNPREIFQQYGIRFEKCISNQLCELHVSLYDFTWYIYVTIMSHAWCNWHAHFTVTVAYM